MFGPTGPRRDPKVDHIHVVSSKNEENETLERPLEHTPYVYQSSVEINEDLRGRRPPKCFIYKHLGVIHQLLRHGYFLQKLMPKWLRNPLKFMQKSIENPANRPWNQEDGER